MCLQSNLKALGEEGDIVIAISTSGGAANVLRRWTWQRRKIKIRSIHRAKGEKFAAKATYAFIVPLMITPEIQETHITTWTCPLPDELEEILLSA